MSGTDPASSYQGFHGEPTQQPQVSSALPEGVWAPPAGYGTHSGGGEGSGQVPMYIPVLAYAGAAPGYGPAPGQAAMVGGGAAMAGGAAAMVGGGAAMAGGTVVAATGAAVAGGSVVTGIFMIMFGGLLCLTLIGAIVGFPMIMAGIATAGFGAAAGTTAMVAGGATAAVGTAAMAGGAAATAAGGAAMYAGAQQAQSAGGAYGAVEKPAAVWLVAVVTLFFGVFGLIPAVLGASKARRLGISERPYWLALGLAFAGWLAVVIAS